MIEAILKIKYNKNIVKGGKNWLKEKKQYLKYLIPANSDYLSKLSNLKKL